jgi:hypothetical protein
MYTAYSFKKYKSSERLWWWYGGGDDDDDDNDDDYDDENDLNNDDIFDDDVVDYAVDNKRRFIAFCDWKQLTFEGYVYFKLI